jgi:hypothetical protein
MACAVPSRYVAVLGKIENVRVLVFGLGQKPRPPIFPRLAPLLFHFARGMTVDTN